MKVIAVFHYVSHARWIFFVWSLVLVVRVFLDPRHHALTDTGLAVFLMGLFLGFLGLSDIEKLSKREKREFADPRSVKITGAIMLAAAGFTFLMGIYFMNIRLLQPAMKESVEIELKSVGYHCFALGFGFLCYLKLVFDKYKHFLSLTASRDAVGDGR